MKKIAPLITGLILVLVSSAQAAYTNVLLDSLQSVGNTVSNSTTLGAGAFVFTGISSTLNVRNYGAYKTGDANTLGRAIVSNQVSGAFNLRVSMPLLSGTDNERAMGGAVFSMNPAYFDNASHANGNSLFFQVVNDFGEGNGSDTGCALVYFNNDKAGTLTWNFDQIDGGAAISTGTYVVGYSQPFALAFASWQKGTGVVDMYLLIAFAGDTHWRVMAVTRDVSTGGSSKVPYYLNWANTVTNHPRCSFRMSAPFTANWASIADFNSLPTGLVLNAAPTQSQNTIYVDALTGSSGGDGSTGSPYDVGTGFSEASNGAFFSLLHSFVFTANNSPVPDNISTADLYDGLTRGNIKHIGGKLVIRRHGLSRARIVKGYDFSAGSAGNPTDGGCAAGVMFTTDDDQMLILDSSKVMANASWASEGGGVYSFADTVAANGTFMYEDGKCLGWLNASDGTDATAKTAVTAGVAGSWAYGATKFFYKPLNADSPIANGRLYEEGQNFGIGLGAGGQYYRSIGSDKSLTHTCNNSAASSQGGTVVQGGGISVSPNGINVIWNCQITRYPRHALYSASTYTCPSGNILLINKMICGLGNPSTAYGDPAGQYTPFVLFADMSLQPTFPNRVGYFSCDGSVVLGTAMVVGSATAGANDTAITDWYSHGTDFGAVAVGAQGTGLSVTSGGTFTRSSGNFTSDGVVIGQTLVSTGFVNAANNGHFTITAVSSSAITVATGTSLVTESGNSGDAISVSSPTGCFEEIIFANSKFANGPGDLSGIVQMNKTVPQSIGAVTWGNSNPPLFGTLGSGVSGIVPSSIVFSGGSSGGVRVVP